MNCKFHILLALIFGLSLTNKAHEIDFIHEDIDPDQIQNINENHWANLDKNIYEGLNNGVYWFRIKPETSNENLILSLPSSHITRAKLFFHGKEINRLTRTRYLAFELTDLNTLSIFYLRVNCLLEANIPIQISTKEEYYNKVSDNSLSIGLYNGFVLAIVILNLFLYFNSGNKNYLYYVFGVISISLGLLYKDGTSSLVLGNNQVNEIIEKVYNLLTASSCMLLCTSYLDLNKKLPQVKWYGISFLLLGLITFLYFSITRDFLFFVLTNVFILVVLTLYLGTALYLFKTSVYAKIFSIAYGFIILLSYDYYLSPHFGYVLLDLPLNQFRIGGIFEMLVFTFAIAYQAKILSQENEEMSNKIYQYSQSIKKHNTGVNKDQFIIQYFLKNHNLTQQEIKVLQGISEGKVNKEIANDLNLSVNTIKFHIRNIYKKLNIKSRKEASLKYFNID